MIISFSYMLKSKKKQAVIKNSRKHEKDTGSPEVQVSMLSEQIKELTKHLKKHQKDNHSRKGLLQMVAKRRSHLKYLEKNDTRRYNAIVKKLSLKSKK